MIEDWICSDQDFTISFLLIDRQIDGFQTKREIVFFCCQGKKVAELKNKHFCTGGICRFISHYRDTGTNMDVLRPNVSLQVGREEQSSCCFLSNVA